MSHPRVLRIHTDMQFILMIVMPLSIFYTFRPAFCSLTLFQFATPMRYATSAQTSTFVIAADFNNDLAPDLAVTNRNSDNLTIFLNLNDGTGKMLLDGVYPTGPLPRGLKAGDIDGDGDLDLVVADWEVGADSISILFNNAAQVAAIQPAVLPDPTVSVLVETDIPTCSFSTRLLQLHPGSRPREVELADVDNDGDLDLITVNNGSDCISVLLNPGNGAFRPPIDYPVQLQPGSATAADFNNDGLIDLAVTNRASDSATILLNQGSGVFNIAVSYLVGDVPRDQAVGDLDLDGDLDVVVVNNGVTGIVSVLLNRGDGSFDPAVNYPSVGALPHAIGLLDIDGNGILDVVVGHVGDSKLAVYRGTGQGALMPGQRIANGHAQADVVTADFNADGKPDLATAEQVDFISILLNITIPGMCVQGDVNGNGVVDTLDLASLLVNWGATGVGNPADVNMDGVVNSADLATLLTNWTP